MSASTPALAAAYWTYSPGAPLVAAPELMLTMTPPEPPYAVLSARTAARATRIAEVRLRSMVLRITSTGVSASGPMWNVAPALLTTPGERAGRREQLVHAAGLEQVGPHQRALSAGRLDVRLGQLGGRVVVGVAEHQVVPRPRQPVRDRGPDPAGAAGDEGAGSAQVWCT